VMIDAIGVLGKGARELRFDRVDYHSDIGIYRLEFCYSIPTTGGP
jgi:hypothetical protein